MGHASVVGRGQPVSDVENCGAGFQPASPSPLKPYHLFEKFGEYFVYHLASNRFFRIDKPTSELLERCLTEPLEAAKARFLSESNYAKDEIEGISQEIRLLADHGLFDLPNWDLSDEEVERQLDARYAAPWTKLELALAETCNLACTYCYCRTCRDMPNQGLMSQEVAKKAIDWLFAASRDSKELGLTLFGGEPLLNKPVFKFVMDYSDDLAKKHGKKIRYSLTTNGTLLDDMVIDYIKKHDFGLMVSLDGPPEIHNAQCPYPDGRGSFEAAAAGIKRLMKRRKSVTVRATLTSVAPRKLDLVRFFEDFGFTRIAIGLVESPITPTPADCDRGILDEFEREEEDVMLPWILEQFERGQVPKYLPYMKSIIEQASTEGHGPKLCHCGACRGVSTVGADGTLYPCHRFVGMSEFTIGHVETSPDMERIRQFWRHYDAAVKEVCGRCWAQALCGRPCPWAIATSRGGFHGPAEDTCGRVRRFLERAAYLHHHVEQEYPKVYEKLIGRRRQDVEEACGPDNGAQMQPRGRTRPIGSEVTKI